ncbi:MAG: MCP four helix bundle domain-containing protein [Ectothiorhodospiraceae bacterium]|nr:MCP four helix bundle domain-containing protein [Ectothiorhodospiraceae bacterium]
MKKKKQNHSTKIEHGVSAVLLGFMLLLALMSGLIFSARQQMSVFKERVVDIVHEQNVKTDLVYTMRFSARERSLDMQLALLIDDWVKRDELMLHYNRMGAQFARARITLLEMKLADDEKEIIAEQGKITGGVVELQNQIFDLAVEGDVELATSLLVNKAIPEQNRVFSSLNRLIAVQRISTANLVKETQAEYLRVRSNMVSLGLAVLLLSVAIAIYVTTIISRYAKRRREDNESLNQMAAFPEQNPSPVFEFNYSGEITYLNPAAQILLPRLEGGDSQRALYERLSGAVEKLRASDLEMIEMEMDIGGHYFQNWVTLIPELETVRVYSLDISDRKRSEAELKKHHIHLEVMVEQRTADLSIAIEELEAFCYSVSHDLRAPLRSIDGFSQVLLEDYGDRLDQGGRDVLGRVRVGAQKMSHLIDDLLRLSQVTRGEFRIGAVDLTAIAEEAMDALGQSDLDRHVDVSIMPGMMGRGDAELLKVVLVNLLSNAWKYTKMQKQASIDVGMEHQAEETVYFVRDNGVGFNQEYADKVFEPFQRLHGAEFEGSGIGMATVFRVVRRHKGRIWVKSQVNAGTCFYFTLGPTTLGPASS